MARVIQRRRPQRGRCRIHHAQRNTLARSTSDLVKRLHVCRRKGAPGNPCPNATMYQRGSRHDADTRRTFHNEPAQPTGSATLVNCDCSVGACFPRPVDRYVWPQHGNARPSNCHRASAHEWASHLQLLACARLRPDGRIPFWNRARREVRRCSGSPHCPRHHAHVRRGTHSFPSPHDYPGRLHRSLRSVLRLFRGQASARTCWHREPTDRGLDHRGKPRAQGDSDTDARLASPCPTACVHRCGPNHNHAGPHNAQARTPGKRKWKLGAASPETLSAQGSRHCVDLGSAGSLSHAQRRSPRPQHAGLLGRRECHRLGVRVHEHGSCPHLCGPGGGLLLALLR